MWCGQPLPDVVSLSRKTRVAPTLLDSVCFLKSNAFCVQCDCKSKWLAAEHFHIPFSFSKKKLRRRNPATFLAITFILFSQLQCVFGSQVTLNSHVMLPAPAGCSFFVQGKTRLTGITGKFQSWNTGKGWPRSTVGKGDVGSCDSHPIKRVSPLWKRMPLLSDTSPAVPTSRLPAR